MTFIFNLRAASLSTPVVINLSKAGGTVKMIAELEGDERSLPVVLMVRSRGGGELTS